MYKIIGDDQKQYGPVSAEQLRDWIAQGRANGQTMVQSEDRPEWRPLANFPEFYSLLNPVTPPLSGPVPPRTGTAPTPAAPLPGLMPTPAAPSTNAMAVAGLVMGLLSVTFGLMCCCGPLFSILGIIFSCVGLSQINHRPREQTGKGIAIAGIVTSVLGVLLYIVLMVFFGFMSAMGSVFDLLNK